MKTLLRATALFLGLYAGLAQSGTGELIRPQPLLAEPRAEARVIANLDRQAVLELVQRQGGWVKVRSKQGEGWVRLLAIRRDSLSGPSGEDIIGLFKSAEAKDSRYVAVAGLRGLPKPKAASHALVLAIGKYGAGLPELKGARHDADAAALIANGMGVPSANITVLQDAQLTGDGIEQAFAALNERVAPGDQVFVYYSGLGTRLALKEGEASRCAEALLAADGMAVADTAVEAHFRRILGKARRLVAFLDTAHADGAATAAKPGRGPTAKFAALPGQTDCGAPSSALARLAGGMAGEGGGNFVRIAAAQTGETAFDSAETGGLATRAWLDCLGGEAEDQDRSGGLSVAELQRCAQARIDATRARNKAMPAQHLAVTGNQGLLFGLAAGDGGTAASPRPAANGTPPPAFATLQDLFANRDDRRMVEFRANRDNYRIGKDRVGFTLSSSHPGHVYILMVGSDGSSFDMLFPNRKDGYNFIRGGETLAFPRSGWDIRPGGPAGKDHLLAIVSDTPRDFGPLGMRASGPFSSLEAGKPGANRDLQRAIGAPEANEREECQTRAQTRGLEIVTSCSDAYGAALLTVVEVE